MSRGLNPSHVAHRFEKAKFSYDENAQVQKELAQSLIEEILKLGTNKFGSIFEVGAGTGLFTRLIKSQLLMEKMYINDIYEIDQTLNAEFILGNAEKIDLPINFDLICANAVFQWFEDLKEYLIQIRNSLTPNGMIAFSSFGKSNFHEIRSITQIGLNYMDTDYLIEKISPFYKILSYKKISKTLYFKTAFDLLKHIKLTGVSGISLNFWSKSQIKSCLDAYEAFRGPEGYPLSYDGYILILGKI